MPTATLEIWKQLGVAATPAQIDPAKLKWGELAEGTTIDEVQPLFPRIDKAKTMKEINEGAQSPAEVQTQPDAGSAGILPAMSAEREQHSGVHATEADAVPGTPASQTKSPPPMQHATEADAVSPADQNVEGVTSFIDITDFTKVDLRVGEVLTAERIPRADKLLLLTVDIGEEKPRQILAGIAQYYEPEQLPGRKIAVVANLKPRKMRGHESQGMLLAASVGDEGKPVLATFTEDVPNGARLK
jgi:methionyl-tRNA synthetase